MKNIFKKIFFALLPTLLITGTILFSTLDSTHKTFEMSEAASEQFAPTNLYEFKNESSRNVDTKGANNLTWKSFNGNNEPSVVSGKGYGNSLHFQGQGLYFDSSYKDNNKHLGYKFSQSGGSVCFDICIEEGIVGGAMVPLTIVYNGKICLYFYVNETSSATEAAPFYITYTEKYEIDGETETATNKNGFLGNLERLKTYTVVLTYYKEGNGLQVYVNGDQKLTGSCDISHVTSYWNTFGIGGLPYSNSDEIREAGYVFYGNISYVNVYTGHAFDFNQALNYTTNHKILTGDVTTFFVADSGGTVDRSSYGPSPINYGFGVYNNNIYYEGSGPSVLACTATPKTGYSFVNWTTQGLTKTGTRYYPNGNDPTFTAKFKANTYTVVYNGNGNTGGSTASSSHTYDVSKNLTKNGFTRTGYTFDGWATTSGGSVVYTDGASVKNLSSTQGANFNLYAHWTANTYSIAYNLNGGTISGTKPSSATYDTAFNVPNPTKTGYKFDYWEITSCTTDCTHYKGSSSAGCNQDAGTGTSFNSDLTWFKNLRSTAGTVTFTAHWTANQYTVTFIANGGTTASPSSKKVTYGQTYGDLATTSRNGFEFNGWWTADEGGTQVTSSTQYNIADGSILYAHWTGITYSIEYVTNGGTISGTYPTSYTAGTTVTLPTTVNYDIYNGFAGWYTQNGLMDGQWGDKVTSISSSDYGDKTFYARYKEYGATEFDNYSHTNKISTGETIYLDVSNYFDNGRGWASDGAAFAFYMFDANGENPLWSEKLTITVKKDVYAFTIPLLNGQPHAWDTVIAVRCNPDPNVPPSWNSKWNQTDNITFAGGDERNLNLDPDVYKNTIRINGWDKTSSATTTKRSSGLVSGNSIYLDPQQYSSDHNWYSGNAKYVIYFFDDFGRTAYSEFMTRVNGTMGYASSDDEQYPLFETLVPEGSNGESVIWSSCIAIRVNSSCTDPEKAFDYKLNQTDDLFWDKTSCFEKNVIKILYGSPTEHGNTRAALDYERSYEYRADAYENYLYRAFCATCSSSGNTGIDNLTAIWKTGGTGANGTNFQDQYTNMNELAQGFFWLQKAVPEGTTAEKAAFLYDYCVNKYGTDNLPDFVKRDTNALARGQNSTRLSFGESENQTTLIIVIAASATLLATTSTLLLVLKKKKKLEK